MWQKKATFGGMSEKKGRIYIYFNFIARPNRLLAARFTDTIEQRAVTILNKHSLSLKIMSKNVFFLCNI